MKENLYKSKPTLEDVWLLFHENEKKWERRLVEEDKRRKEEVQRRKEEVQRRKEEEKKEAKRLKKEKEFDRKFKAIHEEIGGMGKTNGEIAEDFFYEALRNSMKLLDIELATIDRMRKIYRKDINLEGEYDIILTNTDLLIIVEVKYKVRKKDIEKLQNKQIPNFRKLFPKYTDYKIRGAIAGFTFEQGTEELAKKCGFYILKKNENKIKIINSKINTF